VSVVIPTFHREADVQRAIRSALRQVDVSVEVIVLDDSADDSAAPYVAGLADSRIRYERCEQPSGGLPALVRNRGLALARGEFVHFLDDDDQLEDGALAALTAALRRSPATGVAVGVVTPVGDDAAILERERRYFARAAARLRRLRGRLALCAAILFAPTPLVNSACVVRRRVAEDIGGYSSDVPRCEDVEFYLRAIRRSGHVFVERPVVRYQTGRPSLMHSLEDQRLLRQSYRAIHRRYRREHGRFEYLALRLLSIWLGMGALS
jgi:glycosyltransferase involved in cell wall biosynthesis